MILLGKKWNSLINKHPNDNNDATEWWSLQCCDSSDEYTSVQMINGFNWSWFHSFFSLQSINRFVRIECNDDHWNSYERCQYAGWRMLAFMQSANDLTLQVRGRGRELYIYKIQTHKRCDETRMNGDESLSLS